MRYLLLSPHNDDEALFASVICQRVKPLIVVVTDSWVQFNRGQIDITDRVRRDESLKCARVLGCDVSFMGIRDDKLRDVDDVVSELYKVRLAWDPELVFAPARQGGHLHHDLVGMAAEAVFPNVAHYSTYAADQWVTPFGVPLGITEDEKITKMLAIACHVSQGWQGHMAAVNDHMEEYVS
jgi:LmbE family N-acetylglucosaminyl deacetylase